MFDIDVSDYDDVRTCCSAGSMNNKDWAYMATAIMVISSLLTLLLLTQRLSRSSELDLEKISDLSISCGSIQAEEGSIVGSVTRGVSLHALFFFMLQTLIQGLEFCQTKQEQGLCDTSLSMKVRRKAWPRSMSRSVLIQQFNVLWKSARMSGFM